MEKRVDKDRGVSMIVIHEAPKTRSPGHPCLSGKHRAAYLARGGIACGYCGKRLG